jgi:hypothetical protein
MISSRYSITLELCKVDEKSDLEVVQDLTEEITMRTYINLQSIHHDPPTHRNLVQVSLLGVDENIIAWQTQEEF